MYDCIEPVAFTDNASFSWGCDSPYCYGLVCCEGRRFEISLPLEGFFDRVISKQCLVSDMTELCFTINDQFVMFVEDTKTHRIKISWDKGEMWMSKAKALAVHKWLTEFVKEEDDINE